MRLMRLSTVLLLFVLFPRAGADEVLYRYEGEILPLDAAAGWVVGNLCEPPCSESLEDGHFVLRWSVPNDLANYSYLIAEPPDAPPPTLWVEWRFRSNHPLGPNFYSCDAHFTVDYGGMHQYLNMYGDAAISHSASDFVLGLNINEFHSYRYESLDGINYRISVDGEVFIDRQEDYNNGYHYLQFGGDGACDDFTNTVNEWDFVRYGTISSGERIIASDPPGGYLDPALYSTVDRFTVTFDSANYVYIDDITVEVTGGIAPAVIQTLRREADDGDTVEIVLDRPLPTGQRTRFIFTDGETTNVINYCLGLGPQCGDGCCNVDENCTTCAQDCQDCGDGCCTADESACDCEADCPATCGDGCCSPGETYDECPTECIQTPALSDWGLIILTLLTLTAGSVILSPRSARES